MKQIQDGGVDLENMQCNAGLVHAIRANMALACVQFIAERLH